MVSSDRKRLSDGAQAYPAAVSERVGILGWLAVGILATVALYDAQLTRVDTEQVFIGYLAAVPVGLLALVGIGRRYLPPPLHLLLPLWLAAVIGYAAVAFLATDHAPNLIVYDVMALLMPVLWALAAIARPGLVGPRAVGVLLAAYAVAAVLAPLSVEAPLRHDAPSVLLIVAAWMWMARRPGWVPGLALAALLYLTYLSGYRTQLVLWAVVGWLALRGGHRLVRHTLALVAAVLAVLLALGIIPVEASVAHSRFTQVADLSNAQRIYEVRDAWTAMQSWPAWEWFTGSGMGGEFRVHLAWHTPNMREGMLSHIHIGPAGVLFRLGVLGLVVLAAIYLHVGRRAVRLTREPLRDFFRLSMLAMLLDFLVRNVTLFPTFGFVVGGYLFYEYVRGRNSSATADTTRTPIETHQIAAPSRNMGPSGSISLIAPPVSATKKA